MKKQRYYIATQGNDDLAYKEAMQHACKLAKEDPQIKRIVLLISTKRNTGWFERIFNRDMIKKLFEGYQFSDCVVPFKLETKITFGKYNSDHEIVITCGLDSNDILAIDGYDSIKVLISIPWLLSGLEKWVKTWDPMELRGKQNSLEVYPTPSCIVMKAFEELTGDINMATGISHPMDNKQAKTFILALHKYEPVLDSKVVGAYLVRNLNWETEEAKKVEDLIEILNAGKHFQGGERTGLKIYYARWEDECAAEK